MAFRGVCIWTLHILSILYFYTILYTYGPSMNTVLDSLQVSFNSKQHSFRGLQLNLNSSKTKCMIFNRSPFSSSYTTKMFTLDDFALETVDTYKYLGIWLHSSLSFYSHISKLQSKIKSSIGFLFRCWASFTISAKHTSIHSVFTKYSQWMVHKLLLNINININT